MRKFVITGCGRSGTQYMVDFLNRLGIATGHECYFPYLRYVGANLFFERHTLRLNWKKLEWHNNYGEVAWQAAPYLDYLPADIVVFHQVRHPVAYVRSRLSKGLVHARLRNRHVSLPIQVKNKKSFADLPEFDRIYYLYAFWVQWNELVETTVTSDKRYRIEGLDEAQLQYRCNCIGINVDRRKIQDTMQSLSCNTNTRPHTHVSYQLGDMPIALQHKVREKAVTYGYKDPLDIE